MVSKKARIASLMTWLLLMGMLCTGCAGKDILDEIPRDYALSDKVSESVPESEGEDAEGEGESESGALVVSIIPLDEAPSVDFRMEEAFSFAYDSLSEAERIWYHDIEEILGSFGESGVLSSEGLRAGLDERNIDKVFQCVLNDHPELFYVEGYSYTKYTRGTCWPPWSSPAPTAWIWRRPRSGRRRFRLPRMPFWPG